MITDGTDSYRLAQATAGKGVMLPGLTNQLTHVGRFVAPVGKKHGRRSGDLMAVVGEKLMPLTVLTHRPELEDG